MPFSYLYYIICYKAILLKGILGVQMINKKQFLIEHLMPYMGCIPLKANGDTVIVSVGVFKHYKVGALI